MMYFLWSFYLFLFSWQIQFLFSLFITIIQMLKIFYASVFHFCVFFLLIRQQRKQNRTAFCFGAHVLKKT